ncbi:hypothetical protein LZ198_19305 [Myxococcus sp. K15C18031901]|uniref:hypothetical protein n=1 Tax=Myxococcus dinghuensis TaxID=2906761 RepID=UPI0020A78E19|nr:hypothetical protein [Myxococcus dinghuensis]MCP3101026.1 hypothetical protein [Myxococcus dinghuensis]
MPARTHAQPAARSTLPADRQPDLDGGTDAGVAPSPTHVVAEGIRWPTELTPLATLDGPAVLAAHSARQKVLAAMPREYASSCAYSAKAMEVVVGKDADLYFVRVHRRPERCGRIAPGSGATLDWHELYAVSPEGKVLARFPNHP